MRGPRGPRGPGPRFGPRFHGRHFHRGPRYYGGGVPWWGGWGWPWPPIARTRYVPVDLDELEADLDEREQQVKRLERKASRISERQAALSQGIPGVTFKP